MGFWIEFGSNLKKTCYHLTQSELDSIRKMSHRPRLESDPSRPDKTQQLIYWLSKFFSINGTKTKPRDATFRILRKLENPANWNEIPHRTDCVVAHTGVTGVPRAEAVWLCRSGEECWARVTLGRLRVFRLIRTQPEFIIGLEFETRVEPIFQMGWP